ncbi:MULTISPECIES: hypothetical protein [Paraburkholderia]|uniref:hypothetical protein n=1 Tax=Paraburkholderia TaxID=1822464 RepID=UPI0022508AF1|nr:MULTISPECIES: hypothetical protein [Paraburkholderia]MCX4156983.1 hypothetical protein [Paraburkholderia aspalathi]MDN7166387.1 hypothetical protein [Paraburkholderia sp. SECH2]MDQ6394873.1 hypothetical protein [Paraburkholderia aspalathi]
MADGNAALIALIGVLAGGYVNNFLAEDYRRFRDGTALAGALAGELGSHMQAFPLLRTVLTGLKAAVEQGNRPPLRPIETPNDPIYESSVGKIGLLGGKLAEDVAFAYQQIRAFRLNFYLVASNHEQMKDAEIVARLNSCLDTINRGDERAAVLLADLKALASQRYVESRTRWLRSKAAGIN